MRGIQMTCESWCGSQKTMTSARSGRSIITYRGVRGTEHLVSHGDGPVAPVRSPDLVLVFRLSKIQLQGHSALPRVAEVRAARAESEVFRCASMLSPECLPVKPAASAFPISMCAGRGRPSHRARG